jgi:hypothetical protein
MVMKRHGDRSFPSREAFRRLGTKRELAAKLLNFCTKRSGYEDVTEMCRAVTTSAGSTGAGNGDLRSAPDGMAGTEDTFGEVYLLKSGRYYKIGRSRMAARRGRSLAAQLPQKGSVVHVIKTDDAPGIEHYWHRRFDGKRKNGEWFDLNSQDVVAFRRRKFM